jgi:hypothetical protein
MRSVLLVCAVATAAACGGEAPRGDLDAEAADPELDLFVLVSDRTVYISAREVDRPCSCSIGEVPPISECVSTSDAIECDCSPHPADCLERLRLEEGGERIASGGVSGYAGTGQVSANDGLLTRTDIELIVIGCGGEARIPLTPSEPPIPTLSSVEDTESGVRVVWTTTPAQAGAFLSLDAGYGGPVCRVANETEYLFESGPVGGTSFFRAVVHAFEPVVDVQTDLGVAHVYAGGEASFDYRFTHPQRR